MFVQICVLILAFHAIVCQLETIKLDKIDNLVGVKPSKNGDDIPIDDGIILVKKNNEIELFVENFGARPAGGQLKFLTKIKNRLEFTVRQHDHDQSLPDNDACCRLQFVSKHCNVISSKTATSEYYVECRQTIDNPETNLWCTDWRIRYEDKDRYQIEGWETEDYPIYANLHFEYIPAELFAKKCSYSIVFNSQRGEDEQDISREGNRDYVLLLERDITPWEYREEWFTQRKPQPSNRTHFPYGLTEKKQRWTFPKESLVEFMMDEG